MMRLLFLFILIISYSQAHSMVNMRNGSYTEKWVDYIDPEVGIDIQIERFYSSRSLFEGLFGFGWCSQFETKLVITSDGIVNLVECGGGLEITYYPKSFEVHSPDETIEKIVNDFKANNKATSSDIANLRTQLRSNTKMRFELAKKLHLIDKKKVTMKKNTFYSKSKGFEKITFDGRFYERKKFDGSREVFNEEGQLVKIADPSGQYLQITYRGKNIRFIKDNSGSRQLTFHHEKGRLSKITNGKGLSSHYTFDGDNLIEVTNMWSKTYKFSYDADHNMTQVTFPDKPQTTMQMTYEKNRDWIIRYKNRRECIEKYNFVLDSEAKKDRQNHYVGTFSRKCPGEKETSGFHEFWYANHAYSQDKYLSRVYEKYEDNFKNVHFHPYLGRPTIIQENNLYRGFAYLDNGLVVKREDKTYKKRQSNALIQKQDVIQWSKTGFKYNTEKFQIRETEVKTLNKLGKVIDTDKTKFKYNPKGLMTRASKGKGRFLEIVYDQTGKMDLLKDNEKSEVRLTYRVGFDKPIEIEYLKVGKIKISYDSSGEVESVDSVNKRSLASSIVEKFLSMISFLGPLGENLKL